MPYGHYSSQPEVRQTIRKLRNIQQAFCSENMYLVAGIIFQEKHTTPCDVSSELLSIIQAL